MNPAKIRAFDPDHGGGHLVLTGHPARVVDRAVKNGPHDPCLLVLIEIEGYEYAERYRADGYPLRPHLAAAMGSTSHDFRLINAGSWRAGEPLPIEPEGFEEPETIRGRKPRREPIEPPSLLRGAARAPFPMVGGQAMIDSRLWAWDPGEGALLDGTGRKLLILDQTGQAYRASDGSFLTEIFETPEEALRALARKGAPEPALKRARKGKRS